MLLKTTDTFQAVMTFFAARHWHACRPDDHRYGERRAPAGQARDFPGDRRGRSASR